MCGIFGRGHYGAEESYGAISLQKYKKNVKGDVLIV